MRSKSPKVMEKIIEVIDDFYKNNNYIPSMREIAEKAQISKTSVCEYIAVMKQKGVLENNGLWRGVKTPYVNKLQAKSTLVPLVGSIACGTPMLAEENIETYLPLPTEFLGRGKYFVLKAMGESMINAGINDGDYVIVREQNAAEIGQIIVALIDGEATLKRYFIDKKRKQVILHPENDEMEDILFDSVMIQGVAVKVLKDLI